MLMKQSPSRRPSTDDVKRRLLWHCGIVAWLSGGGGWRAVESGGESEEEK